jgi:HAD superfamily hydrolase (TIGR01509 family)
MDVLPRGLLLDLDGTLADSLTVMRSVYDRFLAEHGRRADDGEFHALNGPALPEIVETLRARHALEGASDVLLGRYRALIAEIYATKARLAPGAGELLAAAARSGIAVWIVTSAERGLAERFVAQHALAGLIAGIVTAEGLPRSKPDPAIYLRALAEAGLAPAEAWAVEDSPNGIRAAVGAGITTFALGASAPEGTCPIASLTELVPLLAECTVEQISDGFRVMASSEPLSLGETERRRVDALWEEALCQRPHLFDGTLFAVSGRDGDVLHGRFVAYRNYLAQRRDPSLGLRMVPLGVSGLVVCAGQVAFARRTENTTQYPGRMELVPSGGIDAGSLRADGTVDHRAQLVRELAEETGITEEDIIRIEPMALVRDRVDPVLDVASVIEVAATARASVEGAITERSGEYRALRWVPVAELTSFVERHRDELVPASRALCELFSIA